MSSGLNNSRCFVFGLAGQGNDWHGLTVEKENLDPKNPLCGFPEIEPVWLEYNGVDDVRRRSEKQILISTDDNLPVSCAFNPDSYGYVLPQRAWDMVQEALEGTRYTVERLGMLWDRSLWFVSLSLDELKGVQRPGESFQLNFSGSLDGKQVVQGELSNVRVVCENTLSLSQALGQSLFAVKQTKNSRGRLDSAKTDVERAVGMAAVFNRTLEQLGNSKLSVEDARLAYAGLIARDIVGTKDEPGRKSSLNQVFVSSTTKTGKSRENRALNQVDSLTALFQKGDGNRGETKADWLNGATQYWTRGGDENSKKDRWNALQSSEFGGNRDRKVEAFKIASNNLMFASYVKTGKEALSYAN